MQKKVYVIIVTYNGVKWITQCLSSLIANGCNHVIVLDNASTDNTIGLVRDNFPSVDLVSLNENIGFGAANNIGIKKAMESGCDYIFLLNQDAYLGDNALDTLISTMIEFPNAGILSPLHFNGSGTAFDKNFLYCLNTGTNNAFVNDAYFNKLKDVYKVPMVNAAAWFVSRNCIEKVGLFDSLFYHYGEDNNYCQRVLFHGFDILITTRATILHDRDDRGGDIRPEFSKDDNLRQTLIKLCNPSKDTKTEINAFYKRIKKQLFKSIIKLDFKRSRETIRTLNYISTREKEILINTQKNRSTNTIG